MAGFSTRMAGLLAGVVAGAAMAGCGTVSSGGAGPGGPGQPPSALPVASRALCASPAAVSAVQVTHIPSVAQLEPGKPGQDRIATLTVTDPAKARELLRAVCALPIAHGRLLPCPVQLGGSYQLRFTAAGRRLPLVTIEPGCQAVRGLGQLRLARSPGFWATFSRATGISAPARSG